MSGEVENLYIGDQFKYLVMSGATNRFLPDRMSQNLKCHNNHNHSGE